MKGSLHIATVSGIPVKIHWSFGLLLLWVAYESSKGGFEPLMVVIAIGIVLSIFFCVILHEFGHALTARKFGVKTFDIIMTPIGGIARLERMPEGKGQEFWVAIAGPIVNFLIVGLICLGFLIFRGEWLPVFSPSFWTFDDQEPGYFKFILLANGYLGAFNLIPAFPMDGGRILRSLLSLKMERSKATQIASYAGQVIAVVMFGIGMIRAQPTLALIGVFIFFAARQENLVLQRQTRLIKTKSRDIMRPLNHLLHTNMPMTFAKEVIGNTEEESFIVWSRPGIPAGYITREMIDRYNPVSHPDVMIDAFIIPSPSIVPADTLVAHLYAFMQQHKVPIVIVAEPDRYAGTISWENVEKTANG
ncbi:MAG: site-2 protease family protein [Saprospiraceae bacterium]